MFHWREIVVVIGLENLFSCYFLLLAIVLQRPGEPVCRKN